MSSVDVLIPCYRYGHYLRQCVESVLQQVNCDVRVLILDDASPDNTEEVGRSLAAEDDRVTYRRHLINQKHIATYNEGIEWTSSDYMLLLSADDYLLPGALARATSILDKNPGVGLVFGSVIELTEGTNDTAETTVSTALTRKANDGVIAGETFIRISGSENFVATPTAIVRTSLQKKVGGYRPELPHSGDMEMWLRLAAHGSVGIVVEAQAVWRRHANNMSNAYAKKSRLPDLIEKKAAIDWFIDGCRDSLTDADNLHREMLKSLGDEAIGCASAAFNEQDMELSDQICAFAQAVSPRAKLSWSFAKLTLKRVIGVRAWNMWSPAIKRLRVMLFAGQT